MVAATGIKFSRLLHMVPNSRPAGRDVVYETNGSICSKYVCSLLPNKVTVKPPLIVNSAHISIQSQPADAWIAWANDTKRL